MSIRNNPYLADQFYKHLMEKKAKAYCNKGRLSKRMAKAKALRDVEKLANVPVMKNFLATLSKGFSGAADDLVKNVNAGGSKIVATSADEATAVTQKASGGNSTKAVAEQTQALPKFQAADGAKLTMGESIKMRGANLLNSAAANPGTALALGTAGVGATGLAAGAMLS